MAIIYALQSIKTNRCYIGCTNNMMKRFREHCCLLRNGKHKELELQEDWNRHGASDLLMYELERLPANASVKEKREAEIGWMKIHKREGRLYNTNMTSFSPKPEAIRMGIEASRRVVGNRWTPEANEKRRLAQLGKPKGHGAKISATKQARKRMIDEIV